MPDAFENITVFQNIYNGDYHYGNGLVGNSTGTPSPYTSSPDSHRNISMSSPMSISSSPQHLTNYILSIPDATALEPPYVTIIEQPVEKFRFRYKSEMMGTHGSLVGASSAGSRKKHVPTVQLHNWPGNAVIRCTLVTSDEEQRIPHAHRLIKREGNTDQDDPHHVQVSPESGYIAPFHGMGIIHTAKKHIKDELVRKMKRDALEKLHQKNINATLSVREETQIKTDAETYQKHMNLNSVALCFQAFIVGNNEVLTPITDPVYSHAINNLKSALTGELKICRIDKFTSSCEGGEEVFILVEKVGKKNIRIKFFELNEDDNEIWVDYGRFNELDVHHQYAIVFRTPPYKDLNIKTPKEVYIQLERPSDADLSDAIKFTYKPSDKVMGRKRPRESNSSSFDLAQMITSYADTANQRQSMMSGNKSHEHSWDISQLLQDEKCPSSEYRDFMKNIDVHEYEKLLDKSEECTMNTMNSLLVFDGPTSTKRDVDFAKNTVAEALKTIKTKPNKVKECLQKLLQDRSTYGDTPLHAALRYGQRDLVSYILMLIASDNEYKSFVNIQNGTGKTPLHYAVLQNQPEVVSALLLLGANPNQCDDRGYSPLHAAVKLPEAGACVDALLSEKLTNIEPNNEAGWMPLHLAAEAGSLHAVCSLIRAGADVNSSEKSNGRTALHIAVDGGHKDIVEYLLKETSVDVNKRNYSGNTALHTAVVNESTRAKELCKLLLQYGADPHIPNNDRERDNDFPEADDLEIKKEIDSEDESFCEINGRTSFDLASQKPEILKLLRGTGENSEEYNPQFSPKEEMLDAVDSERFWMDAGQMERLSMLLGESDGWRKIVTHFDLDCLMDANVETNPSLFLLKYIQVQSDISLDRLRDILEDLDEKDAANYVASILRGK